MVGASHKDPKRNAVIEPGVAVRGMWTNSKVRKTNSGLENKNVGIWNPTNENQKRQKIREIYRRRIPY
jgi:hypothetical protein